jgi:hypothetical protein
MEPPYLGRRPPFMTQIRRTHLRAAVRCSYAVHGKRGHRLRQINVVIGKAALIAREAFLTTNPIDSRKSIRIPSRAGEVGQGAPSTTTPDGSQPTNSRQRHQAAPAEAPRAENRMSAFRGFRLRQL